MISVEKIGGTSMSQFGEVLKNIVLRDPDRVHGRVYVVSAYAGVTNDLLEHKKTGEPGIYAKFASGDEALPPSRGGRSVARSRSGPRHPAWERIRGIRGWSPAGRHRPRHACLRHRVIRGRVRGRADSRLRITSPY